MRFSLLNLKLGVIIDRATPATQNGHDKSIRHSSHDSNLQQAHTFFMLKYNLYSYYILIYIYTVYIFVYSLSICTVLYVVTKCNQVVPANGRGQMAN